MWDTPMFGAAAARPHPLTAPASSAMFTTNAAGTSDGWGRRGYTTSPPGRAAPNPATWYFSRGLMTRRGSPMWAFMWATAGCSIVATPSATPTSTRATGSPIFSAALRLYQKPGRSPLLGGRAGSCRGSAPDLPHGAGGVRAGRNGSTACRRWCGQSHLLLAQPWDKPGRVKKYRGAYQMGTHHRQEDPHLAGILRRCH